LWYFIFMSEGVPEQSGILHRIDESLERAHIAGLALLAVASAAGGMVVRSSLDTSAAEARTPSGHVNRGSKPKQVQEYLEVTATTTDGDALSLQPGTFQFIERCKEDSKSTSRIVKYAKPEQPLGKCDIGSSVIVIEQPPLKGDWIHKSGVREGPIKATVKNNHFKFAEQKANSPSESQPGSTPTQPTPTDPIPAAPTQPTQPGGGGGGETGGPYMSGNVGVDISWPQCNTSDQTPSDADFGIVGVNDETGYTTNPCLSAEADNFSDDELDLYVFSGWNDSSSHIDPNSPVECSTNDEDCLAYNYGYNAGLYAVNAAIEDGVEIDTPWWIDVESGATWSDDTTQNQNSIQGEHDALIDGGATSVGVYSTTAQWEDITGGWQNEWPSWGATTWTTPEDAETYCTGHEFTGGPSELMQYQPGGIDHNVAC
jgi:hypothetical protein